MFPGRWYDEIRVGERFGTSVTVTETHLVLGSGMFGDFNPLHVDEEFSRQSIFGGRIPAPRSRISSMRAASGKRCGPAIRSRPNGR